MIAKIFFLCVLYLLCVNGDESKPPAVSSGYETKYDNIDLNDLLRNDRLRKNYVKCLLNEGRCTPDALELKSNRNFCNSFDNIESVKLFKDYFARLSSRRYSHQLLQMHREAKKWFRNRDTLSH